MRDLTQPLEECLQAMGEKRNLQDVLRRYPADRDQLIELLRLSVDLGGLAPSMPAADPAFRLRARNRMLAAATHRRRAQRWNPFGALPRPAARLAFAGVLAVTLLVGGLTSAAASGNSLPGDPLYPVKLAVERAQLAVAFDPGARARLHAQFADVRLSEAQRLIAAGRVQDGVRQVGQYDTAVAQFNHALAGGTFDDSAVAELRRFMKAHEASADASLQSLAGSLAAGGDAQAAAAVTRTRSHADQTWKGSERDLQARSANPPADHSQAHPPASQQPKPSAD
ncbi:MAG: hypothetical protein QOH92_678 [Chloroflexota bacterium]|nr:hypothetical protein [Chloroflexota bacterium]